MNVLAAVSQMLSVCLGSGQVEPYRRTMYEPIRPVKNMTSEQRKTHIPILSWGMPVEVRSSSACGSNVMAAA